MPSDKPKKKIQPPAPQDELREGLRKTYPTLIGGMSSLLTEKEARDVAIPVLEEILMGLRARLEELQDEE